MAVAGDLKLGILHGFDRQVEEIVQEFSLGRRRVVSREAYVVHQ